MKDLSVLSIILKKLLPPLSFSSIAFIPWLMTTGSRGKVLLLPSPYGLQVSFPPIPNRPSKPSLPISMSSVNQIRSDLNIYAGPRIPLMKVAHGIRFSLSCLRRAVFFHYFER